MLLPSPKKMKGNCIRSIPSELHILYGGATKLHSVGSGWGPEAYCCGVSDIISVYIKCGKFLCHLQGGADKSLAWPGMKQATATKLGIYSTYSPRSSVHFLARCSIFCKRLKKNFRRLSIQPVWAAAMTFASDEKWRPYSCFFSPGKRW